MAAVSAVPAVGVVAAVPAVGAVAAVSAVPAGKDEDGQAGNTRK
ncbi:hypothetical protein [Lactobacillus delbrueckii]|nr:hypothetical protein [Lactobacillus delbrueckii]